ncbi:MAG: DUF1015 domain-containing protein [Gammaproteobacteria bacterium]
MHLIMPFRGLRPAAGQAAAVIAPPYDVLSTAEARTRAAGRPFSFLHISKPEIDLPDGTDPYADSVYAKAADNLSLLLRGGVLQRDAEPCYYVYRITAGDHVQTGLVAAAAIPDYDSNRIRKHEFTTVDKENDRVRQIEALNAQTGPVLLAYPDARHIDALLEEAARGAPDADALADDGVRHQLWVLRDPAALSALTRAFDALPALFIADGHHRSAAASRIAASRTAAARGLTRLDEDNANRFLTVIFPHHALRILAYNRVVRDLNGLSTDAFLERLGADFAIERLPTGSAPASPRTFHLYLPGQWYRLTLRPGRVPVDDPVAALDVSLLSDRVLTPLLDIRDLRRDKRIEFVGGSRGVMALQERVDDGAMAAAFALFPTRMDDLMAVADAGQVMPPKSTWFDPKLADGMVSHIID